MKIAVVHSFYASDQPSGENKVVEAQVLALRNAGHDARLVGVSTDELKTSALYPLRTAAIVASGLGRSPVVRLREFNPDVVHVHNLFPNFSRRWVRGWSGPTVSTLHNFRPLCPAATLYRAGEICQECTAARNAVPAVRHACYRSSRIQTVPLALSTRFARDPVLVGSDHLIVLSEKMRQIYVTAGLSNDKVSVVPNFADRAVDPGDGGGPWLFVGRLTEEKGIFDLLASWPDDQPLQVVGDGPGREHARAMAPANVDFLGPRTSAQVFQLMRSSRGLVFPSRWFEGAPLVYVEALAAGCPVLAWKPSAVAVSVEQDGTGMVASDDLRRDLLAAARTFPTLRGRCANIASSQYSITSWVNQVEGLYTKVRDNPPHVRRGSTNQ